LISKKLIDLGVLPLRQKNSRGGFKPHLALRFKDEAGKLRMFSVDTTRTPKKCIQPDAYLITHAHSDHHGKSAMLSERAFCSEKTALALKLRHEREYKGKTFQLGESFEVEGVEVKTYPTGHTVGATAFSWENEVGTKLLVTGDVKDASALPACDVLVTEANYGDPSDPSCHFEDDPEGLKRALLKNGFNSGKEKGVAFGAYDFGKAQRAVQLLRNFGYEGPIKMASKGRALTGNMLDGAGKLSGLEGDSGVFIVPPRALGKLPWGIKKYVLSCRHDYPFPNIRLSDHLDVEGLEAMVRKIDPEVALIYHPKGPRPEIFAEHLNSLGIDSISLDKIGNVLSNEFI